MTNQTTRRAAHRRRGRKGTVIGASVLAAAVVAGGVAVMASSASAASLGAVYSRTSVWDAGYTGQYLVSNTESAAIDDWTLSFDLPAGAKIDSLWNASFSAAGQHVTVKPQAWSGHLAPGQSVDVGFVVEGAGAAQAEPGNCLINNASCKVGQGPTPVPSGRPTSTPSGAPSAAPSGAPTAAPSSTSPSSPGSASPTAPATSARPTAPATSAKPTPTSGPTRPATQSPTPVPTPTSTPTAPPTGAPAGGGAGFAPYVDTSLYPPYDLVANAKASGVKNFTLAFIVSGGGCVPKWGGVSDLAADPVAAQIGALRAIGGDVRVSFGGANGTELASACSSASDLAAAYQQAVDAYGLTKIDFDVEGGALTDAAANTRRDQAIAQLQQAAAAKGKSLDVSFTLPALPTGLTQDGINLVTGAQSSGVRIGAVNIMAMDFGDGVAPNPSGQMGKYAIDAATATQAQVKSILNLSDSAAWAKVAVTPMIGVNDVSTEVFTVADAQQLAAFASSKHLAWLAMWSATRDQACSGGAKGYADATCSSVAQQPLDFSKALGAYAG
ncbi:cellulose binding domain-containing protein [Kitasatospora sp. NBC_01287]|uniref:cellulose binding domain-containing protein n=1 Tax=Kitasatospora sp. NBC_01287 TaxID=2903573 RepID=UPI00224F2536|nr:cellulose binding domain-containing protein [Kitasatospora sp. NBC_01287]MCX4748758.1 cellulose binding domain-containing protein [Kitasatospora sp. NBC_01287]